MQQFNFWLDVWPVFAAIYEILKSIVMFPFPKAKKDLYGEVALVTGAGSGLGRGIAYLLAEKGCSIVCWDLNEVENEKTVKYIRDELKKEAYGFKVDVSNRREVYENATRSEILAGKITILVNNAGIVNGKPFLEMDDDRIVKTFEVNMISHIWTLKAFLPSMLEKNHGHIVSLASGAGYFGVPGLSDYCASKAAAAHFADTLDIELKSKGSNVNVTWICPYTIDTGMFDGFEGRQKWFIDILKPEYVVSKVVEAIETNENIVFLPKILTLLYVVKSIFPRKAILLLNQWSGVNDSMNNFTGRKNQK